MWGHTESDGTGGGGGGGEGLEGADQRPAPLTGLMGADRQRQASSRVVGGGGMEGGAEGTRRAVLRAGS